MNSNSSLARLRAYDDARPGVPGEHLLTLGMGLAVWLLTRHHRSTLVRTAGLMAGSALVGRAASGRDGLTQVLRYLPVGQRLYTKG